MEKIHSSEDYIVSLARFPIENPNPILRINNKGILIFINDSGQLFFKHDRMLVNRKVDRDWRLIANAALRSGRSQNKRVEKNGKIFDFDLSPVKKERYVNVYGHNVTDQVKAEKEAQLSAILLDNSTESIYLHDLKGKAYYVNKAGYKTRGYTRDEFLKMNLSDLVAPEFSKLIPHRINKMLTTNELVFESAHFRKDRSIFPVEVHAKIIRIDNKPYVLSAAGDITERKQSQEQLKETQNYMLIATFISGIVHEIRNPLVGIKGFFDMWNDKLVDWRTKSKFGNLALKEIGRIESLLTNLLNYSKPSPSIYHVTKLRNVLESAVSLGVIEANKKHCNIILTPKQEDCLVLIEAKQMEEVFLNIILNAIQSMSSGGKLYVSVHCSTDKRKVFIIFKDNGCGMPKKVLDRLFQPFFTTKKTGTGLGLSISKRIIADHGGEMDIDSRVGIGTTVTVTLPAVKRKR